MACFLAIAVGAVAILIFLSPLRYELFPGLAPGHDLAVDSAVLEVVLNDLRTWSDSPFEGRNEVDQAIYFSPVKLAGPVSAADILDRFNSEKEWDKLSSAQLKLAEEAAGDVVRRQAESESFESFRPKDRRIVISHPKQVFQGLSSGPQVFEAYKPGYSWDRQLAIVRSEFPWSIHSGHVTYVLAKKDGGWVVLVRSFVYYV
jgi:hypothetical protein